MKVFSRRKGWKIIGIDSEGFDLRSGENVLRYYFRKPIKKTKELRGIFVRLSQKKQLQFNI